MTGVNLPKIQQADPMHVPHSRFSLYTRPNGEGNSRHKSLKRWSFRIVRGDGETCFEATDFEADVTLERLSLLAVVRGLEWFDQPSRITVMNPSKCVSRGLHYGLDAWRRSGWRWERFGQMVLVRNADLWQRIDAALAFHQLNCRTHRAELAHQGPPAPHFSVRSRRRRRATALETA